jgi:hypothetical protein
MVCVASLSRYRVSSISSANVTILVVTS